MCPRQFREARHIAPGAQRIERLVRSSKIRFRFLDDTTQTFERPPLRVDRLQNAGIEGDAAQVLEPRDTNTLETPVEPPREPRPRLRDRDGTARIRPRYHAQ